MSKKILCVSLGYEGGCVYYANQLLNHFPTDKIDVWIAASTEEPFCGKAKKIKGINRTALVVDFLSALLFIASSAKDLAGQI